MNKFIKYVVAPVAVGGMIALRAVGIANAQPRNDGLESKIEAVQVQQDTTNKIVEYSSLKPGQADKKKIESIESLLTSTVESFMEELYVHYHFFFLRNTFRFTYDAKNSELTSISEEPFIDTEFALADEAVTRLFLDKFLAEIINEKYGYPEDGPGRISVTGVTREKDDWRKFNLKITVEGFEYDKFFFTKEPETVKKSVEKPEQKEEKLKPKTVEYSWQNRGDAAKNERRYTQSLLISTVQSYVEKLYLNNGLDEERLKFTYDVGKGKVTSISDASMSSSIEDFMKEIINEKYGYPQDYPGRISTTVEKAGGKLNFKITVEGFEYDKFFTKQQKPWLGPEQAAKKMHKSTMSYLIVPVQSYVEKLYVNNGLEGVFQFTYDAEKGRVTSISDSSMSSSIEDFMKEIINKGHEYPEGAPGRISIRVKIAGGILNFKIISAEGFDYNKFFTKQHER